MKRCKDRLRAARLPSSETSRKKFHPKQSGWPITKSGARNSRQEENKLVCDIFQPFHVSGEEIYRLLQEEVSKSCSSDQDPKGARCCTAERISLPRSLTHCAKALDRLTAFTKGRFSAVNSSQNLDRMHWIPAAKNHPLMCLTWLGKKNTHIQTMTWHDTLLTDNIVRPGASIVLTKQERYLTGCLPA